MKLRHVTALVLFASMSNTAMAYEDLHPLIIENAPVAAPAEKASDDGNATGNQPVPLALLANPVAGIEDPSIPTDDSAPSTIDNEGDTDEINPEQVWDVPGGTTPMSKYTQAAAERCKMVAELYRTKIKPVYGFHTSEADVCAMGDAENGGKPICLGATRGEPCRSSDQGAKGSFQVKDDTGEPIWMRIRKDTRPYNAQDLEINLTVAIAFLEAMEKKEGEANRFRAYNGGAAIHKESGRPNYDKPGPVREKTSRYDSYIRAHIPVYQAILDGKVDVSNAAVNVAMTTSVPVPIGKCWISGFFGDPRTYRNGIHKGMDFACAMGTDVYAIAAGKVAFAGEHTGSDSGRNAGKQVQLIHGDGTIGRLGGSRYMHLDTIEPGVTTGGMVRAGQKIGTVGRTGVKFSGAHLHFESLTWGAKRNLLTCPAPGAWFVTVPFLPNFGEQYMGPRTPGAAAVAKRFGARLVPSMANNGNR